MDELDEQGVHGHMDAVFARERDDRAVDEVDLGAAFVDAVLEHGGTPGAREDADLVHELQDLLAVEVDPVRLRHSQPLVDDLAHDVPARAVGLDESVFDLEQHRERVDGHVHEQLAPDEHADVVRHGDVEAAFGEDRADQLHVRRILAERADDGLAVRRVQKPSAAEERAVVVRGADHDAVERHELHDLEVVPHAVLKRDHDRLRADERPIRLQRGVRLVRLHEDEQNIDRILTSVTADFRRDAERDLLVVFDHHEAVFVDLVDFRGAVVEQREVDVRVLAEVGGIETAHGSCSEDDSVQHGRPFAGGCLETNCKIM